MPTDKIGIWKTSRDLSDPHGEGIFMKWSIHLVGLMIFLLPNSAVGDQFHYNNILIGDRAMGLGGAYTAVADDASGVFYNPAGLAFSLSNDVSGSANAFYSRTVTYKDAIGGADFVENVGGTIPSFFGGLQKLDNIMPGLVFAFGIYSIDSELKDQNDLIENRSLGTPGACDDGTTRDPTTLVRYHRTVNQNAATGAMGAAVAKRFGAFSFGFGVNYITISELVQEYQDVRSDLDNCLGAGGKLRYRTLLTKNVREHLTAHIVKPFFGVQAALGRLSLGLTLKQGSIASQNFDSMSETRQDVIPQQSLSNDALVGGSQVAFVQQTETDIKVDDMLADRPLEVRLGGAFFFNTRFMASADLIHYGESKGGNDEIFGRARYDKEAVTNYALGAEYFVLPQFPVRLGFFTNNDARPELDKSKSGQADHVDYVGQSIFIGYVQPNSQLSLGTVLQQGSGEAQKLGDSTVQDIEAESLTIAFSATQSF